VVHLRDGRILAAWFGGTYEGLEDTVIYTAVRFSPGNWSRPLVAAKVCNPNPNIPEGVIAA
jgi:predicted neuraminidase